jgi:GT2 family glycosyltransferase
MEQDLVTVVIVNYNSGQWLGRCLDGLDLQTCRPAAVIVVDNDSSDDSMKAVRGRRLDIRPVYLKRNVGFAAANNYAINSIRHGEWVALLNPDAIPAPDWLEQLSGYAKAHPEYAAIGSRMIDAANPQRLDGIGDAYHASGLAWRLGHRLPVTAIDDIREPCFSPCAAAALYSLGAFREVGGFEESFFCYYEDVDLGFRLRLAGYECTTRLEAIVQHAGSGTTSRRSDFSVYQGHRNMIGTFIRNMPGYLFWLYLPQHILLNILFIFMGMFRGQGMLIAKAKLDGMRNLPRALGQRRRIQKLREADAATIRGALASSVFSWFRTRRY